MTHVSIRGCLTAICSFLLFTLAPMAWAQSTPGTAPAAPAGVIRITEYMYSSANAAGNGVGEFIELTNVGNANIDLTGWSFDDNSRVAGSFSIGGFGVVQPNESVIITDAAAPVFRTFWYLPAAVKVIGGNDQNLGRSDEINIYDAANTLVTRLTYNDQGSNPANTVRTQFVSAWPQRNLLGQSTTAGWQLSVAGDAQNSYVATTSDLGNPGGYFAPLNRVLVRESGGTTAVTEGGTTDTYTVALNSQPTADVTISINAGLQLTANPASLLFTPSNFGTPQTVTITAVDDAIYQGAPRSVTLTQSAASSDAAYNAIAVNPVSVTITDNDVATTLPPTIRVASSTTAFVSLPAAGPGYVSGVASDPTDPASTLGVNFTLTDADTDVNSLTVTASSNSGNATVNLTGTGSTRNLKINPAGVGYATITIAATDGTNTTTYVINYAASAASDTPATTRFHTGTSDASTAVVIDGTYTLVADDENQVLRLYNRQNSGLPVAGFDFTSSLGLTDLSGGLPREVDIEASIRQGNRIFWIGSQSNKELGPARPNRDRVFATDISGTGASITLSYVGRYDYLKEDIINWDVTNGHGKGANYYGLQTSADAATNSKAPEGYNIEGAELAPNGTTAYIGFRAPQVLPTNRTKALIVAVTNLTSLVNGSAQGSATFGPPIELDLGGRGIREIRKNTNNDYIIIAGPAGDAGSAPNDFRLYTWTGNAADAPVLRTTDLTSLNVNGGFESIVDVPNPLTNTSSIQLLVDNGDAIYYNDGQIAKDLPVAQNNFKKFRSAIVTLGAAPNPSAPFTITSVTMVSCTTISAGLRQLQFTPQYAGLNSQPISFSVVNEMLPTTASGPYTLNLYTDNPTIVLKATQTGTAGEVSYTYNWLATCNGNVQPPVDNASFSITGVTTVNCETISTGERRITFTPRYAGLNSQPISFSVVNELLPTTAPGPYVLRLYTDNPVINLRATQTGTAGEASFSYSWLAACGASQGRQGVVSETELRVIVLGNPVRDEIMQVDVRGAGGQPLRVQVINQQGNCIAETSQGLAANVERIRLRIGSAAGVYLLQVSTPTQQKTVRLLRQ